MSTDNNQDHKKPKTNKLLIRSLIISILTIILLFFTFSFPQILPNNQTITPKAFVSFRNLNLSNKDQILEDQAQLFDTKPIFLPSQWNKININPNQEPDKPLFSDLPPQITLDNYQTLSTINHPELSLLSSIDIFNNKFINSFHTINQIKPVTHPLTLREAYITIKNLNNSKIIKTLTINDQNSLLKEGLWSPLEFLLIVDESGPITPLLITQSSGIEEIDIFFRNYLSPQSLQLNQLPIGYYEIKVNP